jgi:hypothetical protein
MNWERFEPPEAPPPLDEAVRLADAQQKKAEAALADLSAALDGLPAVLSQRGEVVGQAGASDEGAEQLAGIAARIWEDGDLYLAREAIQFVEQAIQGQSDHGAYMIYSAHVAGALVLTVGWKLTVPLHQVRTEAASARLALQRLVEGG